MNNTKNVMLKNQSELDSILDEANCCACPSSPVWAALRRFWERVTSVVFPPPGQKLARYRLKLKRTDAGFFAYRRHKAFYKLRRKFRLLGAMSPGPAYDARNRFLMRQHERLSRVNGPKGWCYIYVNEYL